MLNAIVRMLQETKEIIRILGDKAPGLSLLMIVIMVTICGVMVVTYHTLEFEYVKSILDWLRLFAGDIAAFTRM